MSGGVFVSYRREDTQGSAGRLYDRLSTGLGRETIFFDVDNIAPGLDFVEVLGDRVGSCDALLAVIGGHWISIKDESGQRRLDNPNDFVRVEVEAALERKVPVIPVLVDGARMPRADDLPDSLKGLARRQAAEVSHARFDFDTDRLFKVLRRILDERAREEQERQREADVARIDAEERRKEAEAEAARVAIEKQLRDRETRTARSAERKRRKAVEAEAIRVAEEERRSEVQAEAARVAEIGRQKTEAEALRVAFEQRWRQIETENIRVAEIARREAALEAARIGEIERQKAEAEMVRGAQAERVREFEAEISRVAELAQREAMEERARIAGIDRHDVESEAARVAEAERLKEFEDEISRAAESRRQTAWQVIATINDPSPESEIEEGERQPKAIEDTVLFECIEKRNIDLEVTQLIDNDVMSDVEIEAGRISGSYWRHADTMALHDGDGGRSKIEEVRGVSSEKALEYSHFADLAQVADRWRRRSETRSELIAGAKLRQRGSIPKNMTFPENSKKSRQDDIDKRIDIFDANAKEPLHQSPIPETYKSISDKDHTLRNILDSSSYNSIFWSKLAMLASIIVPGAILLFLLILAILFRSKIY